MIEGYKCFNDGLINRYGQKFQIGKIYHIEGIIQFGNDGNGFHICTNLEDTLRYFDAMNEEINIAKVNCYGNIAKYDDEYYGYYDMYSCEYIIIEKVLTRQEIINYALSLNKERIKRFISLFKLTEEELLLFKEKFSNEQSIMDYIAYYQEKDLEVFKKRIKI